MTENRFDLVCAEIKRLRKEVKDNIIELGNSESERIGLFNDLEIYDNILSFIDSMKKEPASEDFEKEVEKMWAQESKCRDTDYTIAELTKQDYKECARHFANWQKQKDNNDANHALVEQIKTQQMCYEKGMADMKQQLMANAICTTMQEDDCGDIVPTIANQKGFKVGDKVKIIIAKE